MEENYGTVGMENETVNNYESANSYAEEVQKLPAGAPDAHQPEPEVPGVVYAVAGGLIVGSGVFIYKGIKKLIGIAKDRIEEQKDLKAWREERKAAKKAAEEEKKQEDKDNKDESSKEDSDNSK